MEIRPSTIAKAPLYPSIAAVVALTVSACATETPKEDRLPQRRVGKAPIYTRDTPSPKTEQKQRTEVPKREPRVVPGRSKIPAREPQLAPGAVVRIPKDKPTEPKPSNP